MVPSRNPSNRGGHLHTVNRYKRLLAADNIAGCSLGQHCDEFRAWPFQRSIRWAEQDRHEFARREGVGIGSLSVAV